MSPPHARRRLQRNGKCVIFNNSSCYPSVNVTWRQKKEKRAALSPFHQNRHERQKRALKRSRMLAMVWSSDIRGSVLLVFNSTPWRRSHPAKAFFSFFHAVPERSKIKPWNGCCCTLDQKVCNTCKMPKKVGTFYWRMSVWVVVLANPAGLQRLQKLRSNCQTSQWCLKN